MRYAELGVALFAGCVMGWWWGERPEILAELNIILVAGSLGTVATGLAAVYLAWNQQKMYVEDKQQRAERYVRERYLDLEELFCKANLLEIKANALTDDFRTLSEQLDLKDEIKEFGRRIAGFDSHSYALVDKTSPDIFDAINSSILKSLQHLEVRNVEACCQDLKEVSESIQRLIDISLSE